MNPKKILIVEDNEILGDIISKRLSAEGYTVELARNGSDGLSMIRSWSPDLILLDIVLPILNGYEILEAMYKDGLTQKIPVVIISNSGQPIEINRVMALGVRDYVIKANFTPEEVLDKVNRYLSAPDPKGAPVSATKILLVEDEPFLKDLLTIRVSKEHFTVFHAAEEQKALDIAATKHPDIVLLDLVLPGTSGFDILRKLKENPATKDIPVIILSNLGQDSEKQEGLQLGAERFLVKANNSIPEIIATIREVLGSKVKAQTAEGR